MTGFGGAISFHGEAGARELRFFGESRLDERQSLRATLGAPGADDAALILHAYRKWGSDCAAHLTGDFAFAIHDPEKGEVFCARDPFGVKPFYYSFRRGAFVFSSSLGSVRRHATVGDALDDDAVMDFLLFSIVMDPERTTFADIRALPAGHAMRVTANGVHVTRWWTLPIEEPLRFRDRRELIAQFNDHLTRAVADRATPDVAVSMSGGLDSSSIATVARELGSRVFAQTIVWDPLVPDDEERYAKAVAERLGIGLELTRAAGVRLFEKWDLPGYQKEEPSNDPYSAIVTDQFRRAAARAPVMLAGQGGDAVFYASHPYFWNLLRRGRLDRFFGEIAAFAIRKRRLPPLCLRSSFRRARGIPPPRDPLPPWIRSRARLEERWNAAWNDEADVHPTRPQAYNILQGVGWQRLFEYTHPEAMGAPIDYRNPFFDMRLVRFLLRVPPMPWFAEKELLREAMRGRLPEAVRTRRKRPIGLDPAHVWLTRQGDELCGELESMTELDRWVDRREVCSAIRSSGRKLYDSFLLCLPLSLGKWLRHGMGRGG